MRLPLPPLTVLALAVALVALPAAPSAAAPPEPVRVTPVAPGVARAEYALQRADGRPVAAQVLVVEERPDVAIRAELGQGAVPGLETIASMQQRLQPRGAVAALNGGFWLSSPVGDPNGYLARGGQLVSEAETQGSSPRGTFATRADGRSIVDRIDTRVTLTTGTGYDIPVTGVNRTDRGAPFPDTADSVYVFTEGYGASVTLPGPGAARYRGPATVLQMEAMGLAASGRGRSGYLDGWTQVEGGTVPIQRGGLTIVGFGRGGTALQRPQLGEELFATTTIGFPSGERARPALWTDVAEGLAAGPLIVRDGAMADPASWEQEGFNPGTHSNTPAPRSAVGVRADGTTLLVAVDGRQTEHSAGMTMAQLARFLLDLGAVDAISLDGGGSTQLTHDGIVRNRPCNAQDRCGALRPVATGLVVHHDHEPTATTRLAGAGREATAAAVARATYPQGAPEVVLASAGTFPDALAGGPLASVLGAPLLLTGPDALAPVTREAIAALGARRVTLLGGTAAISPALADRLAGEGFAVRRLAGGGRVETAAAIAGAIGDAHPRVFLASAGGFADALSAAAPAGILRAPILLSGRDGLAPAARAALASSRAAEVIVVGGTGVLGAGVEAEVRATLPGVAVTRLAGGDRYGTARAVNEWAETAVPDLNLAELVVARGDTFPDALAGGPFAAAQRRLLMIVPGGDVRTAPQAGAYLDRRGQAALERVTLLGGLGVLSSYQEWQLDDLAR